MRVATRVGVLALLLIGTLALADPPGAVAQETSMSAAEFRALANQAATDQGALERLRSVRVIDGRPVDVAGALAGAQGDDIVARLRVLSDTGQGDGEAAPDAVSARREARQVLDQDKFKPSRVPRPLRGFLEWLTARLEPVTGPIGRLWQRVTDSLFGQIAVVIVVLGLAALVTTVLVGRRTSAGVIRRRRSDAGAREDPADLEAAAAAAEKRGDYAVAVRLRFRAGLLRLDAAGALHYEPSLTTRGAARAVPLESLAALGRDFDEIVYGGRAAAHADATRAEEGWQRALVEVGSKT